MPLTDEYRATGGLWWSGFLGLPTRVTWPLAEIVVTQNRLVFYAMSAKKFELSREDVIQIKIESGFLVSRLVFEHQNDSVPRTLKFALPDRDKSGFDKLKAKMNALGWPISE